VKNFETEKLKRIINLKKIIMKKVLVIALVAVIALASCGKKKEKTNTEKITNAKGWEMVSATITPGVVVSGETTNDWFGKYLYDFEQDDYLVFNANGGMTVKPGNKLAPEDQDGYVEEKASTWKFNSDETKLEFQIPFFYEDADPARCFDEPKETATISKLTETEMVLIYEAYLDFAKGNQKYTFTITYKAK
jgi:hypothetical protein